MEQVKDLCNKVLWLEHGKIKKFGNAHEVISEYELH
jgi:ABC-2 type transport system ATP-binding protein/lipopolysaccharide transport system ATP-binding protein